MNVLTFTEARAGLKQAMDDVCVHHDPTIITRQRGEHVVLLSLADYNSMAETLHLLGNPKNAERLRKSIDQVKSGRARIRRLIEHEAEEQGSS